MYVAFHEVHAKIASPQKYIQNYPNVSQKDAEYFANVENMDDAVGEILRELQKRELLDNTLVIFASDNGPYKKGSAGGLRGLKGEIYDGGIRVPGIFYWKDKIREGQISDQPAGLIDVLPTLARVCDFSLPNDRKIDGANIFPLLEGKEFERKIPLTWFFYRSWPEMAMRMDDYILVGNALDSIPRTHPLADKDMEFVKSIELKSFELYNLKDDPGQKNNLAEVQPQMLDQMKSQMIRQLNEIKREGPYWEGLFEYESLPSKFKQKYIRK